MEQAYSVAEAGRKASVGRTTIYAEIKAGRLRAVKVGRRTLVLAEDLQNWLSSLPQARATSCAVSG
jgi:excisionase family DNA binding protein